MDARQLASRPDFATSYAEWLQHPMTVAIREVVDDSLRPFGIPEPTGEQALYQLGLFLGQSGLRGLIFEMQRFLDQQKRAEALAKLVPRYSPAIDSSGRTP